MKVLSSIRVAGLLVAMGVCAPAHADDSARFKRTIHPVFAASSEVPNDSEAHGRYVKAAARARLGPVEVIDVPEALPAKAAELLASIKVPLEKLKFAEAQAALDTAVAEARATGADGLTRDELADLFLHHAMALQKADWKELPAPPTEITPEAARAAYLQAATLAPDRVLEPRRFPPIAIASYKLAAAEVKARPRGAIVVRAASSALISVDGGEMKPGLVTAQNLPYGDHFIRVEDPGRARWAAVVPLAERTLTVDAPAAAVVTVDDKRVLEAARRTEAAFALVASLSPGSPQQLQLRLVNATTGAVEDSSVVPFLGEPGQLDAAIKHLDEQARAAEFGTRKTTLLLPSDSTNAPPRELGVSAVESRTGRTDVPRFSDDPAGWARARWPLCTAIGVTVGAAVILSIAAAN